MSPIIAGSKAWEEPDDEEVDALARLLSESSADEEDENDVQYDLNTPGAASDDDDELVEDDDPEDDDLEDDDEPPVPPKPGPDRPR